MRIGSLSTTRHLLSMSPLLLCNKHCCDAVNAAWTCFCTFSCQAPCKTQKTGSSPGGGSGQPRCESCFQVDGCGNGTGPSASIVFRGHAIQNQHHPVSNIRRIRESHDRNPRLLIFGFLDIIGGSTKISDLQPLLARACSPRFLRSRARTTHARPDPAVTAAVRHLRTSPNRCCTRSSPHAAYLPSARVPVHCPARLSHSASPFVSTSSPFALLPFCTPPLPATWCPFCASCRSLPPSVCLCHAVALSSLSASVGGSG